jgi:lipoprotein-releasing system permease protein
MKLSLKIAWRYIIGKKSTNAINIISGISIAGLSVGTAAIILVLSVFNGLGELISGMFGAFNPDVIMLPKEGKHFDLDEDMMSDIAGTDGVIAVSAVLEELALFENNGVQAFGKIKGVDDQFTKVSRIGQHMYTGEFKLRDGQLEKAVAGLGIADRLSLNIYDPYAVILTYAPRRTRRGPMDKPFKSSGLSPSGIFIIQQEYDNEYIFSSLEFAQELLDLPGRISAIEVKISAEKSQRTIQKLREKYAGDFILKDRQQQDEAFLKLQNLEKWISYIILSLTLVLVAFNLVGAIWMILREKMLDISVLRSMGYSDKNISRIFRNIGVLFGGLGVLSGVIIALIIYWLQINYGLVTIPDGFAVSTYPVALSFFDVLVVSTTVLIIAYAASWPAAYLAKKAHLQLREN